MMAWAHCPNCSYWRRYDKKVRVKPDETHSGQLRRCPDCEKRVRLSIGGPVLTYWGDRA